MSYDDDSFDDFRSDLWEKAGHIHFEEQLRTFKWAKSQFSDGKLIFTFAMQNFLPKRKPISALQEARTIFDNFRINAAEGIIEEKI